MLNVKKRDGNVVPFDLKKIENAIEKAFIAVNKVYTHEIIELLALKVTAGFTDKVEDNNMTFKDLYDEFRMHNDEIMKATTLCGYSYKEKYIECFFPVKIKDFNIMQFEQWKRDINKAGISLRYKNDIYNSHSIL